MIIENTTIPKEFITTCLSGTHADFKDLLVQTVAQYTGHKIIVTDTHIGGPSTCADPECTVNICLQDITSKIKWTVCIETYHFANNYDKDNITQNNEKLTGQHHVNDMVKQYSTTHVSITNLTEDVHFIGVFEVYNVPDVCSTLTSIHAFFEVHIYALVFPQLADRKQRRYITYCEHILNNLNELLTQVYSPSLTVTQNDCVINML